LQAIRHAARLETAAALAPKERPKQGAVSAVRLGPSLCTAAGINLLAFGHILQRSFWPKQLQPRQSSGLVPICFDCMSPANCRVGGQYRGNHCMADCTQLFAHRGCCSYAGAVCSTGIPCLSNLKGRTQLRYVSCEADCAKLTSMLGGDQQMLVLLRHSHGMHIDQSYDPKKPEILPVTPSWKASHPPCLLWKFCTCAAHLYLSQYGCLFGLHQLKVKLMLPIQDLT